MQKETDNITNLFIHRSAAKRYASSRPYFHPLIAEKIITFTGVSCFSYALDVACGTGQSSLALAEIANKVESVDISPEMISETEPHNRIRYHVAAAEALPFPEGSFNLATVGLAFHWFDQPAFLKEAHRVLKADAWLVVYTSGFSGEMAEDQGFREWAWTIYPRRFPTPPRRTSGAILEAAESFGFTLQGSEKFTHEEKMQAEQLTAYLLTQTNVIAAVEGGTLPLPEAARWIRNGTQPYFNGEVRTMKFGGSMSFLRRTGN